MSAEHSGRCAIVTGSVQGIGLETAKALASAGASVMLTDRVEPDNLSTIYDEVAVCGEGQVAFHPANLTQPEEIAGLVAATRDRLGPVAILVNNAAVRTRESIETVATQDWELALTVNLSAPFHLIRNVLPDMRKSGWGRLVNVSSGFGLIGSARRLDYVTTKTGMIGLTRAVALDLRFSGITCNAVCPGSTWTPRQEGRLNKIMEEEGLSREEAYPKLLAMLNATHFIPAEKIAAAIGYVCSEAASAMTGAAMPVDAGDTAGW